MKIGQKIISGGITGVILKIGDVRKICKANAKGEPIGEWYNFQDVYVKYTNPTTGKLVKGWWDFDTSQLITYQQPDKVTSELLNALIEATSLFDNYPETHEAIGTHEVINEAIKKVVPTWEYLPITKP